MLQKFPFLYLFLSLMPCPVLNNYILQEYFIFRNQELGNLQLNTCHPFDTFQFCANAIALNIIKILLPGRAWKAALVGAKMVLGPTIPFLFGNIHISVHKSSCI